MTQDFSPLTREELDALHKITDARLLALASGREAFALHMDVGAECRRLSELTQRLSTQIERLLRDALPITDEAEILALGFHPEPDLALRVFSILIATRVEIDMRGSSLSMRRWGELIFDDRKKTADLYCYETSAEAWEQLEPDPDRLKTCATGLRTIGDLAKALDVASDFGRIDIRRELEYLDEQLEIDDEIPLAREESDMSGTLKDASSDPVAGVPDDLPF